MIELAKKAGCTPDWRVGAAAAQHGHLHVLQWLHARRCQMDDNVRGGATAGGHLEVTNCKQKNMGTAVILLSCLMRQC